MKTKMKMKHGLLAGVAIGAMIALTTFGAHAGVIYSSDEQQGYDLNDHNPGSGGDSYFYDMGNTNNQPNFGGRPGGSGGSGGGGSGGGGGGGGGRGGSSGGFAFSSFSTGSGPGEPGPSGQGPGNGDPTTDSFSSFNELVTCDCVTRLTDGDPVPEPMTLGLLGAGLVALGVMRRRRKQG